VAAVGRDLAKGEKEKPPDNIVFLNPGEFYFCDSKGCIKTLLGSCIAITLWHPTLRLGGMCHFVLPERSNVKLDSPDPFDGRYCSGAMAFFGREAARRSTRLCDYQAKIFGGSNMLAKSTLHEDELIGKKNTDAALASLGKYNIPLLLAHVGESGYRRIIFDVATGDVWVSHQKLQKFIPTT
jgi:chemotaxis protein CheD